jgi:presenilin-like A22 family membrane protease
MNFRVVIFSGVMAALIGAMFGLAVTTISQREQRKPILVVGGATIGFVIGAFQASIREQKRLRSDEYDESDRWK